MAMAVAQGRPGLWQGANGKGKLWRGELVLPGHFCAGVCACTGVRDSAVAVDVATSAQTGWPGEFLPRLKLKRDARMCGKRTKHCAALYLPDTACQVR